MRRIRILLAVTGIAVVGRTIFRWHPVGFRGTSKFGVATTTVVRLLSIGVGIYAVWLGFRM